MEEAIQRFQGPEAEEFKYRKSRAEQLRDNRNRRREEAEQKAIERVRKAEERQKRREEDAQKPKKPTRRPILQCLDDGTVVKEYPSASAAAREIGVNPKSIRDAATGRQKHSGGFCWKYVDSTSNEEEV